MKAFIGRLMCSACTFLPAGPRGLPRLTPMGPTPAPAVGEVPAIPCMVRKVSVKELSHMLPPAL